MQGRELRGQPVGHTARVAGAAPRRHRVLVLAAQARIEERARAVHLGRANVRVPVGDRAEPGPRVQVDAREAEGRWDQRPGLLPIRPERLPVLVELCVEAARPPAREHRLDGREIDAKEIGEGFEAWRERHDRADVQVAVRPTDEAVFGLTRPPRPPCFSPPMALWSCSASPQNASSPNVSNRKVWRPSRTMRLALSSITLSKPRDTPVPSTVPAGSTACTAPTSPTATSPAPTDSLALRGITVRMGILLGTARSRTDGCLTITSSC